MTTTDPARPRSAQLAREHRLVPTVLALAISYPIFAARFGLPGIGSSLTAALLISILVLVARWRCLRFGRLRLPMAAIALWLLLGMAHSAIWAADSWSVTILYPVTALVALLVGSAMSSKELARLISVSTLLWALVLVATLGIRLGASYDSKQDFNAYGISLNGLASLAALPLMVAISRVAALGPRALAGWRWVPGGLGAFVIFSSASLSVLPAVMFGGCGAVLLATRGRVTRWAAAVVAAGVLLLYLGQLRSSIAIGGGELRGRDELWRGAMELIQGGLPGGIGAEQSYVRGWAYAPHPFGSTLSGGVHNWVLQLTLAYGIFGLALLAISVLAYGPALRMTVRARDAVVCGAVAWAVFAVLARGLVESDGSVVFLRPSSQSFLVWLILGSALAMPGSRKPRQANAGAERLVLAAAAGSRQ